MSITTSRDARLRHPWMETPKYTCNGLVKYLPPKLAEFIAFLAGFVGFNPSYND
jgi:hypothetical protein